MIRVLFVDDESNVLSALRRTMRARKDAFDVEFAESGALALEAMGKRRCDIIVADWRMPGMNGIELLERAQTDFPHAIRVILTGQPVRKKEGTSLTVAHQLLTKPCPSERLLQVLDSLSYSLSHLKDDRLKGALSRTDILQAHPGVLNMIREELNREESSVSKLTHLIEQDGILAARLLSFANSAYLSLEKRVMKVEQAVSLLGLSNARALLLSGIPNKTLDEGEALGVSLSELWKHCRRTYRLASKLAENAQEGLDKDNAVLAAMLHDVGKRVLLNQFPDEYDLVLGHVRANGVRIWQAEKEVFGATHAEVGAYTLGLWGMPPDVVRIVAHHHGRGGSGLLQKEDELVLAANIIDHAFYVINMDYHRPEFSNSLISMGVGAETTERYEAMAKNVYDSLLTDG